jgi:hypothetical protein
LVNCAEKNLATLGDERRSKTSFPKLCAEKLATIACLQRDSLAKKIKIFGQKIKIFR